MRVDVAGGPGEVWGYIVFGALLISWGGGWILSALIAPSTPPGNPTIAFFFVPAGGLLVALGVYLVRQAELVYRTARKSPP